MRITSWRLGLLAVLTVAGGLLIIAAYPATTAFIAVLMVGVLVCCIAGSLFDAYRHYKIAGKTTLYITALIGACAAAAVLMNAGKVVMLTILCTIIASGAANMLYAIHLKRAGVIQ